IAPTIKNNIITDCSYGIHFQNTGNTIAPNLDFNDVWNCGQNYINISDSGENSISENPMFTDHLAVYCGSPCIDRGNPIYFFNDPDGTRNDIGATPVFQVLGYDDIQTTINDLHDYNVIALHSGTYSLSEPLDFQGKDIILMSHDYFSRATITTYNDTLDLFVFDESETESAELRNLILEGGRIAVWCKNSSPTIRGNLIISQNVQNWAAIALSGMNWASSGNSPARIINNTIANSANGGISSFSTSAPEIRNNIIINCTYGIHKQSPFLPLVNDYNDVWSCTNNYINCLVGSNSISCDPDLNEDFLLNANSPCIDSGDPDTVYNDPDGSRNDMGWFPYCQLSYDQYACSESDHSPVLWFNCSSVSEGFSISFHLSYPSDVKIDIYSVDGRLVINFMEDYLNQGTHVINWNGKNISDQIVSNGVYFFTFRTGEIIKSFKSVVIR
ncbi:T9SS type A sorting domain-containing protein, partial [candidate division WOR-3 bacterium]|nr:T9SS type A sorting domain-containing protein [candidate division WOR-3 bacterium]